MTTATKAAKNEWAFGFDHAHREANIWYDSQPEALLDDTVNLFKGYVGLKSKESILQHLQTVQRKAFDQFPFPW